MPKQLLGQRPHQTCTLPTEAAALKWHEYCKAVQEGRATADLTILTHNEAGEIRLYASSTMRKGRKGNMSGLSSQWIEQNTAQWNALEDTAYIYSADDDMQCLAVSAPLDIRRLNKQDCLGKSLRYLDQEIAEPRVQAIQQAIASSETVIYEYTHI